MTSYDDTKVQLTINRMTEECYDNLSGKSSTELYLVSRDPTSPAKIDLDAQEKVDAEISQLSAWTSQQIGLTNSHVSALETRVGEIAAQVGDNTSAISENSQAIGELQNDTSILSGLTLQNAQDIQDLSANLTHSIVRRWEYVEYNGLTFTAEEANSTISMQKVGAAPDVSLEYSTGDGWSDFIVGETTVTLPNIGDQVVIRAKTTNSGMGSGTSTYNKFVMTGQIGASDNAMYLLKSDGDLSALPANYAFYGLFYGCTSLTSAPELPATTILMQCYQDMFNGCTALTTPPPSLPATTLPIACYQGMFNGCTSLTATPATLGATTMSGRDAMREMFMNCTSLTSAFDINVSAPSVNAFYDTFYGCSSLTGVNMSQVTDAPQNAFREMFYGCTSLTTAPDVFDSISSVGQRAFSKTFYGCTSLTQIPTLPTALGNMCFEHMFEGCTGLTGTVDLTQYTNIQGTGSGYGAFDYAFVGCTGITKVDLSNLTTAHGIYHEFDGCTSLAELDLSNLETIRSDSQAALENMCNGCTSLTTVYLNKLASMGSYTTQWRNTFKGCSSLQNIYMNETQTIPYFYNNDTFTGTNADFKIIVPKDLYDQWIVASGWSEQGVVEHITDVPPIEYLDFITTNGVRFSTGVIPTTNTRIRVVVRGDAHGDAIVGCGTNDNADYRVFNGWSNGEYLTRVFFDVGGDRINTADNSYSLYDWNVIDTTNYAVSATAQGGTTYTASGTTKSSVVWEQTPLLLAYFNGQGRSLDISSLQIYEGDTLVKDYKPARDVSGVVCLYDDVSKSCEYPSTGVFAPPQDFLTFTAQEANSTWGINVSDLEYSTDGGSSWNSYPANTTMTLANVGDQVKIRTSTSRTSVGQTFALTGKIAASGSVNSLLNPIPSTVSTLGTNAFYSLFKNQTALTSMPDLYATTIGSNSCREMFQGCSMLEGSPTIYATSLGQYSLYYAFAGCSSMTGEVVFPNLQTANSKNALERCFNYSGVEVVSMPNFTSAQATNAMTGIFELCPNLTTINVPKLSYTSGSYNLNAFAIDSDNLEVVDWSQATQVPAIQQTPSWMFSSQTFVVVVPDNLYDTWISSQYWSEIPSHIVRASEYFNN